MKMTCSLDFPPLMFFFFIQVKFHEVYSQVCSSGNVRLSNGENMFHGTVEICLNGTWGTVGNNNSQWTHKEARVVCRQLGNQLGVPIIKAISRRNYYAFNQPSGKNVPIHLSILVCSGNEKELLDCDHSAPSSEHYSDVSVSCITSDSSIIPACSSNLSNFIEFYVPIVCKTSQRCLYLTNSRNPKMPTYNIANPHECDGRDDCGDCSDDCHCRKSFIFLSSTSCRRRLVVSKALCNCYDDEFKCDNGFCALKRELCDGDDDCGDLSDESKTECIQKWARKSQEVEDSERAVRYIHLGVWLGLAAALLLVWSAILSTCFCVPSCPLKNIHFGIGDVVNDGGGGSGRDVLNGSGE